MRHFSFFILLFFLLTFTAITSYGQGKKSIDTAMYEIQSETSGLVKLSMKESVLPSISQLGGKSPRLILDFQETVYRTPNRINVLENTIVRSLRFGLHKEPLKTRMVIDLVGGCKIEKPVVIEDEDGVSILLKCEGTVADIIKKTESIKVSQETELQEAASNEPKTETVEVHEDRKESEIIKEAPEKKREQNSQTEEAAEQEISIPEEKIVETSTVSNLLNTEGRKNETKTAEQRGVTKVDGDEPVDVLVIEPSEEKAYDEQLEEIRVEKDIAQEVDLLKHEQQGITELETPLQLLEISYSRFDEKDEEQVLFYLNDFAPPRLSSAEGEKLLVICEFEKVHLSSDIEKLTKTDGKYVVSIEAIEEDDPQIIKVILELSAAHDYDLQQVFYKNDNVFSLIVTGQPVEAPLE